MTLYPLVQVLAFKVETATDSYDWDLFRDARTVILPVLSLLVLLSNGARSDTVDTVAQGPGRDTEVFARTLQIQKTRLGVHSLDAAG